MGLIYWTSQRIAKAIRLLIVSAFICAQIASASHVHDDRDYDNDQTASLSDQISSQPHLHENADADHDPDRDQEPHLCGMCLVATYDNDLEPPLTPALPFFIANKLSHELVRPYDVTFALNRDDVNILEPPNLRLSASRAPPI